MRYFYRIGQYINPDSGFVNKARAEFKEGLSEGLRKADGLMVSVCLKGLSQLNSGVTKRSIENFKGTNVFNEVTKEQYEEILADEKEILSRQSHIDAGIKHWHHPVKTDAKDCERFLKNLIGEDEVEIWTSSELDKQNQDV